MEQIYEIFNNIKDDAIISGAIVLLGLLTALFTFYKQVATPMYNKTIKPIVTLFTAIVESPERISAMEEKVDLILQELRPNSGRTIKDQINRLSSQTVIAINRQNAILDSSPHGVWEADSNGDRVWVNATMYEKLDIDDPKAILGKNWINAVYAPDRKIVLEEWTEAVKNRRNFDLNYRLVNEKTGEIFPVRGTAAPVFSYGDNLVGYNGVTYFKPGAMATAGRPQTADHI